MERLGVSVHDYSGEKQLLSEVTDLRRPAVIRGCPLGPCSTWTPELLAERLSGTSRPVHVTQQTNMDFVSKNFHYSTMDIGKVMGGPKIFPSFYGLNSFEEVSNDIKA